MRDVKIFAVSCCRAHDGSHARLRSSTLFIEVCGTSLPDGQPCLWLAPLYRAEVGIASQLLRLLDGAPPWGAIDPAQVLTGKVTVITGGPGVGKTTIVTSILQALRWWCTSTAVPSRMTWPISMK
jgi:hypothetical protein